SGESHLNKILTGRIDSSRIRSMSMPRPSEEVLARYRALGDATSAVSDALDDLGIRGAVAASTLVPTISGARMIGTALTLRNSVRQEDPMVALGHKDNRMAEIECHNLAEQGDVLVIQGVSGVSNMGGVGTRIGKRQGEAGAIVDGGIREVTES